MISWDQFRTVPVFEAGIFSWRDHPIGHRTKSQWSKFKDLRQQHPSFEMNPKYPEQDYSTKMVLSALFIDFSGSGHTTCSWRVIIFGPNLRGGAENGIQKNMDIQSLQHSGARLVGWGLCEVVKMNHLSLSTLPIILKVKIDCLKLTKEVLDATQ